MAEKLSPPPETLKFKPYFCFLTDTWYHTAASVSCMIVHAPKRVVGV